MYPSFDHSLVDRVSNHVARDVDALGTLVRHEIVGHVH